jgi:hypothetical protein
MKWMIINYLPLATSKDPSLKVWVPYSFFASISQIFLSNIVFRMLQTFFSQVTLLVRAPDFSSFLMNLFHFSPPYEDFL